uniref:Serpentine receptor class gamma n=1 Tax=Panagrellus redivivus TaxID=6233 RepID=A0A7E5A2B1_PANRE
MYSFRSYLLFVPRKLVYWKFDIPFVHTFNEPNFLLKIIFFLIWWFGHAQFQLTVLICFNRFASIALRDFYNKYWTPFTTKASIIAIFAISFCIAAPIFALDVVASEYITITNGTQTVGRVGPVFADIKATNAYRLSWKVHIYAIIATSTIFYLIMFLKLKEIRTLSKNTSMRKEMRLMYPAFVLFLCNVLYIGYFTFRDYLTATIPQSALYTEWTIYIMGDLYDLNNVFVILMTSKEVRKALTQSLGMGSDSVASIQGRNSNLTQPRHISVIHR